MEHWWKDNWQRRTEVYGEEHTPVSLCHPHTRHTRTLGLNPELRGGKSATNRMYGVTYELYKAMSV
jgi:hypothetical protein